MCQIACSLAGWVPGWDRLKGTVILLAQPAAVKFHSAIVVRRIGMLQHSCVMRFTMSDKAIQGSWVSVWGSVTQLRSLPEPFGMRICEIEAYATAFDTRFEERSCNAPQDVMTPGK